MLAALGFGEVLWTLLVLYVMVNVLIATVAVALDLFRSDDLSSGTKVLWLLAFFVVPLFAVIVYLLKRGDGIGARNLARAGGRPDAPPPGYSAGPATELQVAKGMLDDGTISTEEYERMKARLLA